MSPSARRLFFWAPPIVGVAAALIWAVWPRPVDVDLWTVDRGDVVVTVAEEGRTRIADVYTVSAPVRGLARRIDLEGGDPIVAGQTVVAEIAPADPVFLDLRSAAEAEATVEAARAALALAQARLVEARAEFDFAAAEVERIRTLRDRGAVSGRALEDTERLFLTREAAVATAGAAVRKSESELVAAEMRLLLPTETRARAADGCPCIPILAPVSGKVLRVLHESEGVVNAGDPLIEIGDPGDLEVVAEFLSVDAVRIRPGARAKIADWGGPTLDGAVTRVEPYAFTKISALGIEEQRVRVTIRFDTAQEARDGLGHGYQVEVLVWLDHRRDVVRAPLTALLRDGDGWSIFAVEDGTARARPVKKGQQDDFFAVIDGGLTAGEVVISHPRDDVTDGMPVRQR